MNYDLGFFDEENLIGHLRTTWEKIPIKFDGPSTRPTSRAN